MARPALTTSISTQVVVDDDLMDYDIAPQFSVWKSAVERKPVPPVPGFTFIRDTPRPESKSLLLTSSSQSRMAEPVLSGPAIDEKYESQCLG